jgi:hypothetical protein
VFQSVRVLSEGHETAQLEFQSVRVMSEGHETAQFVFQTLDSCQRDTRRLSI